MCNRYQHIAETAAILACILVLSGAAAGQEPGSRETGRAESTLVRVLISRVLMPESETSPVIIINDRPINQYRPKVIQKFSATGVVIDGQGSILAFLGFRWVDVQGGERQVEIFSPSGKKLPGKLLGIDESNGTAVVRLLEGKLERTPLCQSCEIQEGATVVTPVIEGSGPSQFQRAQIVSSAGSAAGAGGNWEITIDRHLQGVGEPIMDVQHRVLGFVASQQQSKNNPEVSKTVVFPIGQLLNSAKKILASGGDIRTGWLGVYIDDTNRETAHWVRVASVLEGGPAEKAGLREGDVIAEWDGTAIQTALQFIRLVQNTPIGDTARIGIRRDGKPMTVSAVIEGRRPEAVQGTLQLKLPEEIVYPGAQFQGELIFSRGKHEKPPKLGITAVPLTQELAAFLKMPGLIGLLISNIEEETPAAQAGLRVGDVIVSVNGQKISDPAGFLGKIQTLGWGSTVNLTWVRNGVEHSRMIRLSRPK